jgi:hypothetical protein
LANPLQQRGRRLVVRIFGDEFAGEGAGEERGRELGHLLARLRQPLLQLVAIFIHCP